MTILPDGTVVSSGSSTPPIRNHRHNQNGHYGSMRCKVAEVLYIDDDRNTSKNSDHPQVQYNCVVLDGPNQGVVIRNVVDNAEMGGKNNFTETIRHADTKYQPGSDGTKDYRDSDGDIVLVQNINGRTNNPVIMSGYKHPQAASSATKDKGETKTHVFNGVMTITDKLGNMSITNISKLSGLFKGLSISKISGVVNEAINSQINEVKSGATKIVNGAVQQVTGALPFKLPTGFPSDFLTSFFSKSTTFHMSADGTIGMLNGAQKMVIDKLGQISMTSIGGTGLHMLQGGVSHMISPVINMNSLSAFNVKSALTSIGLGGLPSARIGDITQGIDSHGGQVISKVINGSFISMIGS